jgi:hypothetical protein
VPGRNAPGRAKEKRKDDPAAPTGPQTGKRGVLPARISRLATASAPRIAACS